MKHLDQLLDELQEPIAQLMDWCDADKDRAVVACIKDLLNENSVRIFEAFCEAYPDQKACVIADRVFGTSEEVLCARVEGMRPDIDYAALYQPLEHIINDRIDFYNRS